MNRILTSPHSVQARTYTADALKEIAFPLGGIGTGTLSLGGRAQLRDWEIFNRPAKGKNLPCTFFALWCRPQGGQPIARILERRLLPPFAAERGLSPWAVSGLPRLEEARFRGTYPVAEIAFSDSTLPLEIALEAFTPFTPFDDRTSGMPVAIFLWRLCNRTTRSVDATLVYSQLNPIGYDGVEELRRGRRHPMFGGNLNRWCSEDVLRGIQMTRPGFDGGHPGAGSLAIASTWPKVTFSEHWERSGWFDDIQNFWDDLRADGRLPDSAEGTPSPAGETDVGSLGAVVRLEPGVTAEIPFLLAWHLPNLVNYWGPFETLPGQSVVGQRMRNWYTSQWPDAWAVVREVCTRLPELTAQTRAFRDALFASTVPEAVIDAVSSQLSIIRTPTCLRTEDGRLHGFEGCD
ncbi:MAG TPA: GH116 family glycosyl-hydrolase, partial [Candidatus Methylomirabilis sp.]|nr:GH116 family glycosyl-hydrolase [Candidatus Methylomirabilis sp.]